VNASVQASSCEGPTATYLQHAVKHVRSQLEGSVHVLRVLLQVYAQSSRGLGIPP